MSDTCADHYRLDASALRALPRRQRAGLINGLSGYKPAHLVGTTDEHGRTNLALFTSVTHIGAAPPLIGMIVRPRADGTERHTLDNILTTGVWTMNAVTRDMVAQAHQTAAKYPRDISEFDAVNLSIDQAPGPEGRTGHRAPFVAASPVQMGLTLAQHTEISLNGTHFLIGEVREVFVAPPGLREDGSLDLAALQIATVVGLDSWHVPGAGVRYPDPVPTTRVGSPAPASTTAVMPD